MDIATIESMVEKIPESGCWIWMGSLSYYGYGRLKEAGRTHAMHRAAYRLYRGDPGDMQVCHRCDVRACVNPAHLFLGTGNDNMQDKMRKGRHRAALGEAHGSAILTEADIVTIRESNESNILLAQRYGVSYKQIWAIRTGRAWKHVA